MPQVRVLHVLEALETGCARHVVDLVEHLPQVHHIVAVPRERVGGVTDHRAVERLRAAGADVRIVEMRRRPYHPLNAVAVVRLLALIRATGPDVVHGHSSIGGALARVAATVGRRPRAYTPNGLAAGRGAQLLERGLGRLTDRFVAVSDSERTEVVARRLIDAAKVVAIPNGVEAEAPVGGDLRALVGVDRQVPLIGSMGRLLAQKAPEVLVAAFARIAGADPRPRFVLIGEGPQSAEIDALVDRLGLGERFQRIPSLPEAARYLGDLTVFVLASRFEGGPYAPLEAMRAGVPVVLTDVVGSRDAVDHGRTGVLVEPESPGALADAVIGLLRDPAERSRLADAGRAAVAERFDLAAVIPAYLDLYRDLRRDDPATR